MVSYEKTFQKLTENEKQADTPDVPDIATPLVPETRNTASAMAVEPEQAVSNNARVFDRKFNLRFRDVSEEMKAMEANIITNVQTVGEKVLRAFQDGLHTQISDQVHLPTITSLYLTNLQKNQIQHLQAIWKDMVSTSFFEPISMFISVRRDGSGTLRPGDSSRLYETIFTGCISQTSMVSQVHGP